MTDKEKTLTPEEYKRVCILDAILFASCTNEDQASQMVRIIENRKKQKEKLCVESAKTTHS